MQEMFTRGWEELLARETGPLHFRLIFQPLVALFFAIRSGLKDARAGRPVFFWTLVLDTPQRRAHVREVWADVGKLFLAVIALDVLYQCFILHCIYPVQALFVAVVLAILPYLLFRGMTNRLARQFLFNKPTT